MSQQHVLHCPVAQKPLQLFFPNQLLRPLCAVHENGNGIRFLILGKNHMPAAPRHLGR